MRGTFDKPPLFQGPPGRSCPSPRRAAAKSVLADGGPPSRSTHPRHVCPACAACLPGPCLAAGRPSPSTPCPSRSPTRCPSGSCRTSARSVWVGGWVRAGGWAGGRGGGMVWVGMGGWGGVGGSRGLGPAGPGLQHLPRFLALFAVLAQAALSLSVPLPAAQCFSAPPRACLCLPSLSLRPTRGPYKCLGQPGHGRVDAHRRPCAAAVTDTWEPAARRRAGST